ncbi:glycosyltransferase [Microbacterium testaceum]|uniref:glycosyltransferase n=1 Tax=Microbacterium testaceum TaxID=2033 RepID=UPI001D17595B|nr:glycosyltransferase [Microbacterium testaceum]MCC4249429.1 glycosyltransferase [Microbacterium testaceum]
MKIAHVVTYVSPDGAFGGPVRVALGQAGALAERGHDVTVYAAAPPALAGTSSVDGYTLKTFPARRLAPGRGFAAMAAPQLTRALSAEAASFDVAHIHLARDLVTLPAARQFWLARVPYFAQPHGMINVSDNPLAKPLDAIVTRTLLRDAQMVLTLTDREVNDITAIEAAARTAPISNGIRIDEPAPYEGRENVVLFLARLHPRKRPLAFVEMAKGLKDALPATRFVLAGPDGGEGAAVRAAIADAGMGDRLKWIGAVSPDDTEALLASVQAYVLPAVGEVFPMTILESLRVGTPVVTTHSLDIASECERFGAAVITDGSPEELAEAVTRVLLADAESSRLRAGGQSFLREKLDIARVAETLEALYVDQVAAISQRGSASFRLMRQDNGSDSSSGSAAPSTNDGPLLSDSPTRSAEQSSD